MTRQEIYNSIISIAHHEVESRGFKFSPSAEIQLKEMVSNGVYNTMTDAECNNVAKIAEAQKNMREICIELCNREERKRSMIVESRTFTATRFQLCPRYPFC